jgi:methylenetetrahydrofolate reductase (NADPH)
VKELAYLKENVDAGADFILTRMFFDFAVFEQFVEDCRRCGITCPIIPVIMCIYAYAGFHQITSFCKAFIQNERVKRQ